MGIKSNIGQSVTNDNVGIGVVPVDGTNKLQVEGNASATSFIGDGSQLTGVASAAQGALADTALQPLIDNVNVIFRGDGVNTFNISRNGNIDGSTPFLDILCDTSSTRLRATGSLSFWNRPLNGGISESARINQDGNIGIGTTVPTEKLHVNGKIKATSINFTGLPTSATGLSAGDVWNDAGTLKIV